MGKLQMSKLQMANGKWQSTHYLLIYPFAHLPICPFAYLPICPFASFAHLLHLPICYREETRWSTH